MFGRKKDTLEVVSDEAPKKTPASSGKKDKKKPKKEGTGWFKGTGGELKRVSWPSFGKVVKQTGIVVGVTFIFLVVVSLMDYGLGAIYNSMLGLWS